jgi:hypothetical protein
MKRDKGALPNPNPLSPSRERLARRLAVAFSLTLV